MQAGLLLLVHGEVTDPDVDMFDRERVFIEKRLAPLLERVPDLKVVMEHITTKDAAEFVAQAPPNVAATITPQHMMLNRNALFVVSYGSLRLLATSCGICCTGAAPGDIMVPRHMLLSQNGSPVYEVMHLLALVCAPWALLSREQAGSLEPQCLHGQPAPQTLSKRDRTPQYALQLHFTGAPEHLPTLCNFVQGGLRPHHYCLPILKREQHRAAVAAAAVSGSPKFFLGTDSAPHARSKKVQSPH